MTHLGNQLIINLYACPADLLNDIGFVEKSIIHIAKVSGATVINSLFHQFSPYGITGLLAISESHFAIHTWPEHHYATIDVFSCGNKIDYDKCITLLQSTFQAKRIDTKQLKRGELNINKEFIIDNIL